MTAAQQIRDTIVPLLNEERGDCLIVDVCFDELHIFMRYNGADYWEKTSKFVFSHDEARYIAERFTNVIKADKEKTR